MICKKCNNDKGDDFRKNRNVCRECDNQMAREKRKELKEKKKPDFIICRVCEKKTSDFRINRKKCLDCERTDGRKYRKENPEKAKTWTENNKELHNKLKKDWYNENKKNISKKITEKFKNDEYYKYKQLHGTHIRKLYLENIKENKKYINCTTEFFNTWIVYQQKDDMEFKNYNEIWVMDHVIPCYTNSIKIYDNEIVYTWMNIKPINKNTNLVKNKYLDIEQLKEHKQILTKFCSENKIENTKYMDILNKLVIDTEYLEKINKEMREKDVRKKVKSSNVYIEESLEENLEESLENLSL